MRKNGQPSKDGCLKVPPFSFCFYQPVENFQLFLQFNSTTLPTACKFHLEKSLCAGPLLFQRNKEVKDRVAKLSQMRGSGWQETNKWQTTYWISKAVGLLGHATNSLGNLNSNVHRIGVISYFRDSKIQPFLFTLTWRNWSPQRWKDLSRVIHVITVISLELKPTWKNGGLLGRA